MTQNQQTETTEQIWRALSDRLRRFVRSRIASPADVDDVLQTVFLRIHSKLSDLRQIDRLEAWVFQITRNAMSDHFRKQRDAESDVESLIDDTEDADAPNAHAEIAGCLRALIDRLPDEQQRAVSMYELEGLSQKEIAGHESISLSGAKSRIQRGRKSLESMLKACCAFQLDGRGNVLDYEPTEADCCDDNCK